MESGISSTRLARAQHRHELRALAYVTLDQANGGIVRNLNRDGIGAQVVAAVRPGQHLRVRFELRNPRVRIETQGEVMWATPSGQCGIRFLDVSPKTRRQLNEWVFGDLLEGASLHARSPDWIFPERLIATSDDQAQETSRPDGLMVSGTPLKVIELPLRNPEPVPADDFRPDIHASEAIPLDWLSQPLSGRGLAWTVNVLVVLAALLLCVLVFLSVNREAPRWPMAMTVGAAILVAGMYWGFFQLFGNLSLGERLARLAGAGADEAQDRGSRFR
jgi:PilZ domain